MQFISPKSKEKFISLIIHMVIRTLCNLGRERLASFQGSSPLLSTSHRTMGLKQACAQQQWCWAFFICFSHIFSHGSEKHCRQNIFPTRALVTGMPRVLTCHKITKANRGESDHHKVNGLQGRPPLNVFENDSGDCHKHNTAGQDEQDGRDDPDLGLTHLLFLKNSKRERRRGKSAPSPWIRKTEVEKKTSVALNLSLAWAALGESDESCGPSPREMHIQKFSGGLGVLGQETPLSLGFSKRTMPMESRDRREAHWCPIEWHSRQHWHGN